MGEAKQRDDRMKAISEIGHQFMVENAEAAEKAFGDGFETVTATFIRRRDDPDEVFYFGVMTVPELMNLVGEMSRTLAVKRMLGNE